MEKLPGQADWPRPDHLTRQSTRPYFIRLWKQEEAQQEIGRCLSIVTNVAVSWNTVYAQLPLQRQQLVGPPALPEHPAPLSPARFAQLNGLGRYAFPLSAEVVGNGLRPLGPLP